MGGCDRPTGKATRRGSSDLCRPPSLSDLIGVKRGKEGGMKVLLPNLAFKHDGPFVARQK